MERRLAAILAADVAGYSRLMAADESGTHARYKALRKDVIRPRIVQNRGRIVKLMGDGALVVFASVVDAVECAAAIQKEVAEHQSDLPDDQRIAFRIGINIGDIIIEDEDIYGGGVNIAVRLEQLAEPGGVCIARNVYNQVKDKVVFGFESMGVHNVKNIPEPVVVYRLLPYPVPVRRLHYSHAPSRNSLRIALVATVIVLLGFTGVAAWLWPWANGFGPVSEAHLGPPIPDKPSIAVLPFENLSGDPEQEYLSDGITEDLIADLSNISGLSVATRTAAFQYKSSNLDPQQVARNLAVRYVLEGSIRKIDNRVQVSTQLIDITTGHHQWSENFDGDLDKILDIQDDMTKKILAALQLQITEGERDLIEHRSTNNFDAYKLYLRGVEMYRQRSRQALYESRKLFERAIDLDPKFAEAHARLAHTYFYAFDAGWEGPASLNRAVELTQKAVALDDLREAFLPD
jgi:adenylate cyclase